MDCINGMVRISCASAAQQLAAGTAATFAQFFGTPLDLFKLY